MLACCQPQEHSSQPTRYGRSSSREQLAPCTWLPHLLPRLPAYPPAPAAAPAPDSPESPSCSSSPTWHQGSSPRSLIFTAARRAEMCGASEVSCSRFWPNKGAAAAESTCAARRAARPRTGTQRMTGHEPGRPLLRRPAQLQAHTPTGTATASRAACIGGTLAVLALCFRQSRLPTTAKLQQAPVLRAMGLQRA